MATLCIRTNTLILEKEMKNIAQPHLMQLNILTPTGTMESAWLSMPSFTNFL